MRDSQAFIHDMIVFLLLCTLSYGTLNYAMCHIMLIGAVPPDWCLEVLDTKDRKKCYAIVTVLTYTLTYLILLTE